MVDNILKNTSHQRETAEKTMDKKVSLRITTIVLAAILLFMYQETPAAEMNAAAQTNAPEITYTVSMSKPWTHLLEVEMHVKWNSMPAKAELKMPVWTPGSYLIREYARHVQDFSAANAQGTPLTWEKINKNTWQIDTAGAKEIVAKYNVYANELTVRTNELNDEHAFWNNGGLLMFPKGQLAAPSTVKVLPYSNWKIATGLPKVAGSNNTFRAANFDILYDSPFEVSNFNEITVSIHGKPHRVVITGEGNYDLKKIAVDLGKIADEGVKIFGELPPDDYTVIVNLRGGGGLEHLNSTALQYNRFGFEPQSRYVGFLSLLAHEYFHLWNVKRLRPDALGPFDYENENYTKMLWVAEGGTAYYESAILLRAGLISAEDFLSGKARSISQLQNTPGRFETSLEDASFDAWIKYYRPDENAVNNQISYYDKGDIVNWLLDMIIRSSSNGQHSLDDVLRYLYDEFYKKGKNYGPADYQKAAEMMAGKSLEDFFDKYVRGTDEIDYNAILQPFGLKVENSNSGKRAELGAVAFDSDGRFTIRSVPAGTPAYEQGLNAGDQIVAIDGYRASQGFLQSYLAGKKPGDTVKIAVFRHDKLREFDIKLGADSRASLSFVPVDNPTADQQRLYRQYFLADLGE